MKRDIESKGDWSVFLDDENRLKVDVWTRHSDNLARSENRAWLRSRAKTFANRWIVLTFICWSCAFLAEGVLVIEVPLSILGAISGCISMGFIYVHKSLNVNNAN